MKNQVILKQIMSGLNEDLQGAYASGIQQLHYASLLGDGDQQLVEDFNKQSMIEFEHVKIIKQIILYLSEITSDVISQQEDTNDYVKILKEDLQKEYNAITRYLNRIKQFEYLGMEQFCQKIKGIIEKKELYIKKLKELIISLDN